MNTKPSLFSRSAGFFLFILGVMFFQPGPALPAGLTPLSAEPFVNQDADRTALARELYELARLDAFTRNTTSNIQEIILDLTSDQQDESFSAIILDAFNYELMESVMLRSLSRSIREQQAADAAAHLQLPEIRELTRLLYDNSTDFSDPETEADFQTYLLEAELNPEAFTERIRLLSEILRVSQTARITVQSIEDFLTIIIFALNQTNSEEEQLNDRQLNDLIISLRSNFRQLFDNVLLYVALYATRYTDEAILEQHLHFLQSESGGWFIRAYNNAVLNGFGEVSEKVAAGLAARAIQQAQDSDAFDD
ncbi:MAG: hypothetical protein LAT75_10025 [Candidatus Cyclonatronum sp.]|uniref:hypothetical protein n=1 Tax=Cyclonatronum sp. TaxID=3024185 RepID=UPI0025C4CA71|nr:hypothetical protein [Cyclonatronum sp.]MCH8487196.1 hypothetical protein [Cyclonatronum sp.]